MLGIRGFTEYQIDEFSYKFFNNCIRELGILFNFESIKGLVGNCYVPKALDTINEANPINIKLEDNKVTKTKARPTLNMMRNFGLV